jgi:hypothetical protein
LRSARALRSGSAQSRDDYVGIRLRFSRTERKRGNAKQRPPRPATANGHQRRIPTLAASLGSHAKKTTALAMRSANVSAAIVDEKI